jgi:hypothetical protein
LSFPVDDRVRALVEEANALLGAGLSSEAADIFGRVLLVDPTHREAMHGLDRARQLLAEKERRLEACVEDATRAAKAGENETARRLAEQALREGGDAARVQVVLDRVDERSGRLDSLASVPKVARAAYRPVVQRRTPPSRQVLVAFWTVAFVTLAVGLAFSWDRLVGDLVSAPAPESALIAPPQGESETTPGDVAVRRARELVARGDLAAALVILDDVSPADPEYPFARRLRSQVAVAVAGGPTR